MTKFERRIVFLSVAAAILFGIVPTTSAVHIQGGFLPIGQG